MIFSRRFLPYFITQSLGAMNDNVYKNVLLLLVTYSQVDSLPIGVNLFVNLAAGLFILPFFLFSAYAGLIADNIDKALLIRRLKLLEMIIMACGAAAILTQSYLLMLLLLFLMGSQSAFFGPAKYSLLPRVLSDSELVTGNAWVEMGTFVSILAGTIGAGLIVASDHSNVLAAVTVCVLALLGYLASCYIPAIPLSRPAIKLPFRPLSGALANIRKVRQSQGVWMAILAISWFWFFGATYLTQFPNFAKLHLHGGATVVSLLLALFSIGIGVGSFVCERLSFKQVELGLLPFGLLGLTLFGVDLYFAVPVSALAVDGANLSQVYTAATFISEPQHYRLMFDLFMIGASGGLFIVPLYAFIQARTAEEDCAQAIAANNIMNALFMVVAAIVAMVLLGVFDLSILTLFLLLAIANFLVGLYLYITLPELRLRLVGYLLSRLLHPVSVSHRELLPKAGAVILVGNGQGAHQSAKALVLIQSLSIRPIRFVTAKKLANDLYAKVLRSSSSLIECHTAAQASGKTSPITRSVADKDVAHAISLLEHVRALLANQEMIYLSQADYSSLLTQRDTALLTVPKIAILVTDEGGRHSSDALQARSKVSIALSSV